MLRIGSGWRVIKSKTLMGTQWLGGDYISIVEYSLVIIIQFILAS